MSAINTTTRARLVWQRVWAVASDVLVAASAHADPWVASAAAEGLGETAARLLRRGIERGDDALRPFLVAYGAVSGPSRAHAHARVLLVGALGRCLRSACARDDGSGGGGGGGGRAGGFCFVGEGWSVAIEVLRRAARDPAGEVAAAAHDACRASIAAGVRASYASSSSSGDGNFDDTSDKGVPSGVPSALTASAIRLVAELAFSSHGKALAGKTAAALREIAMDAGTQLAIEHARAEDGDLAAAEGGDSAGASPAAFLAWRAALRALAECAAGDWPGDAADDVVVGAAAAKTAGTNTVTPAPGTLSSPPPPPKPALDALFGVLASFPDGLPARAWAVAADVAVKPLVDLESRRKKIKMDSGKIRSGAIGSHAAAADWASSRVEPVLVSLCTLCSGSRVARAALLTPLIEALPAMTGSAREELAAHALCATRHVAATLSATSSATSSSTAAPESSPLRWAWDGIVRALRTAIESGSPGTSKAGPSTISKSSSKSSSDESGGAVAALLAVQITSDILRESPPSTTPWASRLALLDLLAIAHAAAASGNAARGGHARHIRLEISAGVSYLRSLERELDEANGAAGRLDPAEVSTRVDVLSARLREHVVRVLADAAAFAKEEDLDGADTDAGAGANENAAPSNADSVNYGTTSNNIAAVDPTDDGSAWLARAAANRAGRAFREPLAAAAIDALGDMEDGDAESFARAIRDALPSATTLIAVGRAPMSGALARLFGGALKRRLGPTLRGEKTAVEKKKEAAAAAAAAAAEAPAVAEEEDAPAETEPGAAAVEEPEPAAAEPEPTPPSEEKEEDLT